MTHSSPAQRTAAWANRKYPDVENLNTVLVDSPSTSLRMTKKDVLDYYTTPEVQRNLLPQLRQKDLIALVARDPNNPIIRRYRRRKEPVRISDKKDLDWYAKRRYVEFHPTLKSKSKELWVDLDAGKNVGIDEIKPAVKDVQKAVSKIPNIKKTDITFSGGRGFHVRGELNKEQRTSSLEKVIKRVMARLARRNKRYTTRPPKTNEIRLDTSTFHERGSIRAPFSLNQKTGLVSVPVKNNHLKSFDPIAHANPWAVIAELRRKKKTSREFAPGIPENRAIKSLPSFKQPKSWIMSVQEHDAKKAGKHYDLRLVDPWSDYAHSWAIPKSKLPRAGEKPVLAIQTPTHTSNYALTFGAKKPEHIAKGYGAGTVQIKHKEPVQLTSSPDFIKFKRQKGRGQEENFVLFRTKGDSWLLRNVTKSGTVKEAVMSSLYWNGFEETLQKLGMSNEVRAAIKQRGQSENMQQSLETEDQGLPSAALAKQLQKLPVPEIVHKNKGQDSVENRLNRSVSWGPKQEISHEVATGPSPIMGI